MSETIEIYKRLMRLGTSETSSRVGGSYGEDDNYEEAGG